MDGMSKLEKSKELIDMAADCGADCVKFQLFKADKLYSKHTPGFKYMDDTRHIIDVLKPCELPSKIIPELIAYCGSRNVEFCCTPFSIEAVDVLEAAEVKLLKVASFNIIDIPLLRHIAKTNIPVILSTGMATSAEVEEAVHAVEQAGIHHLLHCNSQYPTPLVECNLAAIRMMAGMHLLPVGYSDHTESALTGAVAVGFGATCLEKHVTLSKSDRASPDAKFALDGDEFALYVSNVRAAEQMIGKPFKGPSVAEKQLYKQARVSIHAARNILAGKVLEPADLTIKRPGIGLHPRMLETLMGSTLCRDLPADTAVLGIDIVGGVDVTR
jgi:sialic acid synthase SpsE